MDITIILLAVGVVGILVAMGTRKWDILYIALPALFVGGFRFFLLALSLA